MIDDYQIQQLIQTALREDIPAGDVSSIHVIDPGWQTEAVLLLKQNGVAAGLPIAEKIFHALDPHCQWNSRVSEGTWLSAGTELATITGKAQAILQAERAALNLLQRLSGIATLTYRYVQEARKGSATVRVTDTRKTTPGLRYFEKYAVRIGGGHNHRLNLSDAVMLKDNHLALLAQHGCSLKDAIRRIRQAIPHTMTIEVEVDSLEPLEEILTEGVEIILLDNMNCDQLRQAVQTIGKRAVIEASGGITLKNIAQVAATGVNIISVGALTHSAPSLDISLDMI